MCKCADIKCLDWSNTMNVAAYYCKTFLLGWLMNSVTSLSLRCMTFIPCRPNISSCNVNKSEKQFLYLPHDSALKCMLPIWLKVDLTHSMIFLRKQWGASKKYVFMFMTCYLVWKKRFARIIFLCVHLSEIIIIIIFNWMFCWAKLSEKILLNFAFWERKIDLTRFHALLFFLLKTLFEDI